jgi:LmbE family N-acetylglucosaminyl deacetylase
MKSLVIAPHPDDEILGMGGTLFRKKKEGGTLAWLIMTEMKIEFGWDQQRIKKRNEEIKDIAARIGFDRVFELKYPTTALDQIPISELVKQVSIVIENFQPNEIFVPHPSDVHSDHKVTYQASISASKWFRSPTIKRILAYETLSETGMDPCSEKLFTPNYFVDIELELESKLKAASVYASEISDFPFPRSLEAIQSLAKLHGSRVGMKAAEAFQLLNERNSR